MPRNPPKKPTLVLLNRQKKWKCHPTRLLKQIEAACRFLPGSLPVGLQSIECVLVTLRESRRIHQEHFSDPTPTDVMTFSMPPVATLIVCPEMARQQRHLESLTMEEEILTYFIHGLLHLTGLDDRTDKQYRTMRHMQKRLLIQATSCP